MERPQSGRFEIQYPRGNNALFNPQQYHDEWFRSCIDSTIPTGGKEGMDSLEQEAARNGYRMELACSIGIQMYPRKRVVGLTKPECVAVIMFTLQDPDFYRDFNEDCSSGRWRKYKVFSTCLFSACLKLAEKDPVRQPVYRGVRNVQSSFNSVQLNSTPFYWPQFSSASLEASVARKFSPYVQEFSTCQYGAKLKKLSAYPDEEEVLILPFEKFAMSRGENGAVYKSARDQPLMSQLLQDEDRENYDSNQRGNQYVGARGVSNHPGYNNYSNQYGGISQWPYPRDW